jgi:cytosine/adenosine deaminase-related metal-dependent hydrolase
VTLYLRDAMYLDPAGFTMKLTHLAVDEGPTGRVTPVAVIPEGAKSLDCGGRTVMRSFACGHHHIYSALARGMPQARKKPGNFREILERVWWRLDKCLDKDMIEASALATAMACAKSGVTFVIDHHSSPNAVSGSLETIAKAFDKVGLGHLLCYEMSCRDGEAASEAGLAETDAYLSSGRMGHVGLHASFTVDDALLARAVDLADKHGTGIHMHVAEDAYDQEHCQETYGKRVVERLKDFGVLDVPRSLLVHCVHLDDAEREIIRRSSAWVVQNAESNLNNAVGLTGYSDFGPRVMLGTDGMHSDMFRSVQVAYLVGQGLDGVTPMGAYLRFRATHAYVAGMGAPGDGGNNLVVLDYDPPTDVTPTNFTSHFIYGLRSRHMRTVIAQGKVVVEDRKLVGADESDILRFSREQARRLWAKLEES